MGVGHWCKVGWLSSERVRDGERGGGGAPLRLLNEGETGVLCLLPRACLVRDLMFFGARQVHYKAD